MYTRALTFETFCQASPCELSALLVKQPFSRWGPLSPAPVCSEPRRQDKGGGAYSGTPACLQRPQTADDIMKKSPWRADAAMTHKTHLCNLGKLIPMVNTYQVSFDSIVGLFCFY
jgi:hypothetical protein